jgi:NAD(P)H-hydrate epimerase
MKIVNAEQMRGLDSAAINTFKVPSLDLMENAGHGTVNAIVNLYGDPLGKTIAIFVGPGNNGGDGLVIARLLAAHLARPVVFLLVPPENLKGDAAVNLKRLNDLPVPIIEIATEEELSKAMQEFSDCSIIVDSIFGTGLTRKISGLFATTINKINAFPCPVVAVDMPSGLNSDSGKPMGPCVTADITVTFGEAKIGQVIYPGREYTGDLQIVDIGIPEQAVTEADIKRELLDSDINKWLPERPVDAHKGIYGHLLVIAGSLGKTGAAQLCSLGGLRSGTGLVTLCIPYELNQIVQTGLWETMTVPLQSKAQGILSIDDYTVIAETLDNKQAVAVGPGIGTADETAELIMKLYQEVSLPMVIDADGLNILARDNSLISTAAGPRILTPHPGEMARLTGMPAGEIQANRLQVAADFATKHEVHLILKGAETIVCSPDGYQAINPTGNPGMAAAGMGDVLTGMVGGFMAQGMSPWRAACLGVYVHGLAADRLAEQISAGYLASEVADELPYAMETLKRNS